MSTATNPASVTSPNINNYYIGRGIVFWTPIGGSERDMGNCPSFQFKPAVKNLDHFSSRKGLKLKDLSIIIDANATVALKLDEWTADNLAIALLGLEGATTVDIMSQSLVKGQIRFVGSNQIGPIVEITLPTVSFAPKGTLDFISEDKFAQIELEGDVLADATTGSFGTMAWTA